MFSFISQLKYCRYLLAPCGHCLPPSLTSPYPCSLEAYRHFFQILKLIKHFLFSEHSIYSYCYLNSSFQTSF